MYMEAKKMAKKSVVIACPKCGTVSDVEYSPFFGRTARCRNPKCENKFNIKKESTKVVNCPSCRCDVIYDALKDGNQSCPNCHAPLNSALPKKYDSVRCPYCGQYNDVSTEDKECTCISCSKTFSIKPEPSERAVLIEARFNSEYIIWQYRDKEGIPINRFPIASRLIVPEGMTALLLRNGVCKQPVEPSPTPYLLSDSRLGLQDQLVMAMANPDELITADIFFVRNQFQNPIAFSDKPAFIEDAKGIINGKLSIGGNAVVRVANAKLFADFVGYQTYTEEKLVSPGTVNEQPSKLRVKLRTAAFSGVVQAVRELVKRNGWAEKQIELHKEEIQRAACPYVNKDLETIGLEVTDIILGLLEFTPDPEMKWHEENWRAIQRYTEQLKHWVSLPMSIHMKDDPTLSAVLTLEGTYQLVVEDQNRYMRVSQVDDWIRNGTGEGTVNDYCITRINELLKNVLPNVIQSYINDANADIRELQSHYHRLRSITEGYLKNQLAADGLGIRNFVMEQKSLILSPALQMMTGFDEHRTINDIDLKKYAYDKTMDVKHSAVDMQTYLDMDDLKLKTELRKDENDALREELRNRQEARRAGYGLASMDRQHDLEKHEWDLKHSDLDDDLLYQQKKMEESITRQANLDELKDRVRMQAKLRSADELRTEWEQKKQMEEDQLDAEIRQAEKKQAAGIRSQQADMEARHQNRLSEAENQRMLSDIMRRIAESDLDLKEKLDAYERLCQNNKALDEMQHIVAMAKTKADAQYSVDHARLALSQEENALLEDMARQAEEREERRKQAEFQREMERRETQVLQEMEKLKLAYDQEAKAAEMEERLFNQQAEIEKLKLMLEHYTQTNRQDTDAKVAIATADSVRAQAEREYELRKANDAREEAQRQERARYEREDKYSAQAERLLTQMWEIQATLDKSRIETDQKRVEGQAQADIARAQAEGSKDMQALIRSLEKMVNTLNNSVRRNERQQQGGTTPVFTPLPVSAPAPNWGNPVQQPNDNTSEQRCPKCGRPITKYSTLCVCGQYLG